jgi:hypothetical protein
MKMENLTQKAYETLVNDTQPQGVHEVASGFYSLYEEAIRKAIDNGIKEIPGDFYVLGIVYKDPMIKTQNVLRIRARCCATCPTPTWNSNVYKYHVKNSDLELLWSIPSLSTCCYYEHNKLLVPPSEYCILQQVLDYHSGKHDLRCSQEQAITDPTKAACYKINDPKGIV